jgi:segregation and condensation protein B
MPGDNIKPVIEALLFSSDSPLSLEQIKAVLDGLGTGEIRAELEELKSDYEKANRGMRINEIAGGFQMVTASNFAVFLKKLYKGRRVEKLSRPALEALAIVAYKQPVSRQEIESVRNVNCDGVLKHLLERNLTRVAGRKKAPGRPFVFGTTRKFLEYFGLKSLEELPKLEELKKLTTEGIDGLKKPAQKS